MIEWNWARTVTKTTAGIAHVKNHRTRNGTEGRPSSCEGDKINIRIFKKESYTKERIITWYIRTAMGTVITGQVNARSIKVVSR